uniref:Uncharacterized protein n=1 Tax=viral metagenome TaxID=1070528 RepID=A0A6C0CR92_9ZZZZ
MSEHMVEEYIWRFGEPPERSAKRETEKKELSENPEKLALEEGQTFISDTMQTMVSNGQYDMIDLALNQAEQNMESNKRQNMNDKLSDRYMVQQTSQNPFLIGNNYVQDLDVQESFLRPKSSHLDNHENKHLNEKHNN